MFIMNKFSEEIALSENGEIRTEKEIILSARGITKKNGEDILLSSVDVSIPKKGIYGILAPHGAGKTCLMEILSLSGSFDEGMLTMSENVISPTDGDKKLNALRKKIGYAAERCELYPSMTAFEVMVFVGETRRVASAKLYRQIKEALELLGIDGCSKRLVKNLNPREERLLGIAAALIGNPDIIFIDGLSRYDLSGEGVDLASVISMLGKRKTVVVSTADYKIAKELCKEIVILSDGKVLAFGSFDELEKRAGDNETTSLEAMYKTLYDASKYTGHSSLLGDDGSEDGKKRRSK